ncbi:hypothetical protein BaRGS_00036364 [Batillaria attramentaria]|uniref:Apple domain-containing protein n=1 Tax=Batillaria attramentaria TaxID=370345 RepID=A0ABD0JCA0_9CAEN
MFAAVSFILFLGILSAEGGSTNGTYAKRYPKETNDVISTNGLVLTTQVMTKGECALQCLNTNSCVSFTFQEGETSPMTCRGYAAAVTSAEFFPSDSEPWLYILGAHNECFGGDYGSVYTKYTGSAIVGYNAETVPIVTVQQCFDICDQRDWECQTFDYELATETCHMRRLTRAGTSGLDVNNSQFDHYQKSCLWISTPIRYAQLIAG